MKLKFFKLSLKEMILVSIFAALTAVFSQISIQIPFSPVPITMQVLAVCLAAAILGKKCGTLSQIIYILIGIAGFPVFSGFKSGLGSLLGPTGGYILSFPFSAFIIGYTIEKQTKPGSMQMFFAMLSGLAVCYFFGTLWLGYTLKLSFSKALLMGIEWYLPLDMVKLFMASFLACEVLNSLK
ncbi:MAG TPA: biotin transporter BioY [Clostridiales bacterium]|nr:biotin transporter BioY [Clostridiales bacterium]